MVKKKKSLIIYQTMTGNTEIVALRFKKVFEKKGWDCDIFKIDIVLGENYDASTRGSIYNNIVESYTSIPAGNVQVVSRERRSACDDGTATVPIPAALNRQSVVIQIGERTAINGKARNAFSSAVIGVFDPDRARLIRVIGY